MGLAWQLMASLNSTVNLKINERQNTLSKMNYYTCFILLELKLVRRTCTFNSNGRKLCRNFPNKYNKVKMMHRRLLTKKDFYWFEDVHFLCH